jgi:hypothetical protein
MTDTILGGNFNCILDPADTKGDPKKICYELKPLIGTHSI